MITRRVRLFLIVASLVVLALGAPAAGSATDPPEPGVTVPYAGNLAADTGGPVADGAYMHPIEHGQPESSGRDYERYQELAQQPEGGE